jgi:two-component system chemotaxis response regulator CheB
MSQDPASLMIVIGASAGGVSAFLKLAASLPPDFPCPILIVQHIGAHRSRLAELLRSKGPSRAVNAEDGVVPVPGTIYVAPADHHMLVRGGRIQLSRGAKENHARPAIDPLFRSAALEYGNRVIGVVLTGLLDDGAAGLRAIKDCGGTTVVQDVHDALEASMPMSAMASTKVDYTVTINKLAGLLGLLVSSPRELPASRPPRSLTLEDAASRGENAMENLHAIGRPSVFSCPDCGGVMFEIAAEGPARFRCHTGHAFSLLSLTAVQEELADEALWTALRAMQEKEAGLRRLAESTPTLLPRHSELLAEARALAAAATTLRALTVGEARFGSPAGAPSAQ